MFFSAHALDDGYIMAGITGPYGAGVGVPGAGIGNAWLIRTDSKGNTLWNRTFRGPLDSAFLSVKQDSYGGYILTGYTEYKYWFNDRVGKIWMVRIDNDGELMWDKQFKSQEWNSGTDIIQTSNNEYVIIGKTGPQVYLKKDEGAWIIKTDVQGIELWNKSYGKAQNEEISSIIPIWDGGFIFVGKKNSDNTRGGDAWLVKYQVNNTEQWNQTFGGDSNDAALKVISTLDGGYLAGGRTGNEAWIIKTDENGLEKWNRTFRKDSFCFVSSIQQTFDKGYILLVNNHVDKVWLIKTDSNGNQEWEKIFVGVDLNIINAHSVFQNQDGGYVFSGYWESNSTDTIINCTDTQENERKKIIPGFGISTTFILLFIYIISKTRM